MEKQPEIKQFETLQAYASDRHYFGTISSLCLFKNYLLIGNGNLLKILDYNNSNYLYSNLIFEQSKITKIKLYEIARNKIILLIGETELKYCLLNGDSLRNLNPIAITNYAKDYIADVYILERYLIIGYVNNFIDIIEINHVGERENLTLNLNYLNRQYCPEKCIVYSMNIINYNKSEVVVASGTVFRNIIIWKVNLNDFKSTKTILNLKGHGGVVFSLYFADLNNLLSVSDDRTAKHWVINYDDLTYDVTSYHGHSARIWDGRLNLKNNLLVTVSEDCTGRVYDLTNKKLLKELDGAHLGQNIRCLEMDDNNIFTAGEDWQIVKWDIADIRSQHTSTGITNDSYRDTLINFSLPIDDNCKKAREKQKSFSPAVKVLKFITLDQIEYIMIGTNHGEVYLYDVTSNSIFDEKSLYLIYSDFKLRVVNSLDLIQSDGNHILLVGLSDGCLGIVNLNDFVILKNEHVPKSSEVNIFSNIRITFLFHKYIDDNNIILILSTPLGNNKIFLIPVTKLISIKDILQDFYNNNAATIITGSKHPLPISSAEILEINSIKGEYLIFLGDSGGNLYFTPLKRIGERFYSFFDVKFLKIHSEDKISYIKYIHDEELLYTCGRDGKIKKFLIRNKSDLNKITINEVDCKTRNEISSFEYLHKDKSNFFLVGHHGRDIILMDYNKNTIFYCKDVKGCYRAFDIHFKDDGNITYAYSENGETTLINLKYNPMNSEMKVVNYNTPLHGKLIHSNLLVSLNEEFSLLVTASEDTKINFYTFSNQNISKLVFIDQFARHRGAVRNIHLIENISIQHDVHQKVISLIFCSVGAGSETFIFKLQIYIRDAFISKHCLFFLCDLTQKQQNLDTRNMSCDSIRISSKERKYLLTFCNTLANYFIFLFDFDKNEFQPELQVSSSLKHTNFIPLCLKICQMEENNDKSFYLIFGLTNGVIYIKQFKLNSEFGINLLDIDKQYRTHEAGINDLQLFGYNLFTCGEDNSLVVSYLTGSGGLEILKRISSLHSSPIKSINILPNENNLGILTAGYDQNVNVLNFETKNSVELDQNRIDLNHTLISRIKACTAEINSSSIITNYKGNFLISVAGQGIELFKLKLS